METIYNLQQAFIELCVGVKEKEETEDSDDEMIDMNQFQKKEETEEDEEEEEEEEEIIFEPDPQEYKDNIEKLNEQIEITKKQNELNKIQRLKNKQQQVIIQNLKDQVVNQQIRLNNLKMQQQVFEEKNKLEQQKFQDDKLKQAYYQQIYTKLLMDNKEYQYKNQQQIKIYEQQLKQKADKELNPKINVYKDLKLMEMLTKEDRKKMVVQDYYLDILRFNPKTHTKHKKYKALNLDAVNKMIQFQHPTLEKVEDEEVIDETGSKQRLIEESRLKKTEKDQYDVVEDLMQSKSLKKMDDEQYRYGLGKSDKQIQQMKQINSQKMSQIRENEEQIQILAQKSKQLQSQKGSQSIKAKIDSHLQKIQSLENDISSKQQEMIENEKVIILQQKAQEIIINERKKQMKKSIQEQEDVLITEMMLDQEFQMNKQNLIQSKFNRSNQLFNTDINDNHDLSRTQFQNLRTDFENVEQSSKTVKIDHLRDKVASKSLKTVKKNDQAKQIDQTLKADVQKASGNSQVQNSGNQQSVSQQNVLQSDSGKQSEMSKKTKKSTKSQSVSYKQEDEIEEREQETIKQSEQKTNKQSEQKTSRQSGQESIKESGKQQSINRSDQEKQVVKDRKQFRQLQNKMSKHMVMEESDKESQKTDSYHALNSQQRLNQDTGLFNPAMMNRRKKSQNITPQQRFQKAVNKLLAKKRQNANEFKNLITQALKAKQNQQDNQDQDEDYQSGSQGNSNDEDQESEKQQIEEEEEDDDDNKLKKLLKNLNDSEKDYLDGKLKVDYSWFIYYDENKDTNYLYKKNTKDNFYQKKRQVKEKILNLAQQIQDAKINNNPKLQMKLESKVFFLEQNEILKQDTDESVKTVVQDQEIRKMLKINPIYERSYRVAIEHTKMGLNLQKKKEINTILKRQSYYDEEGERRVELLDFLMLGSKTNDIFAKYDKIVAYVTNISIYQVSVTDYSDIVQIIELKNIDCIFVSITNDALVIKALPLNKKGKCLKGFYIYSEDVLSYVIGITNKYFKIFQRHVRIKYISLEMIPTYAQSQNLIETQKQIDNKLMKIYKNYFESQIKAYKNIVNQNTKKLQAYTKRQEKKQTNEPYPQMTPIDHTSVKKVNLDDTLEDLISIQPVNFVYIIKDKRSEINGYIIITNQGIYFLKQNEQLIDMVMIDKIKAFTICQDEPNLFMSYQNHFSDKTINLVIIFPIPKMIVKLIIDTASQLQKLFFQVRDSPMTPQKLLDKAQQEE